MRWQRGEWLFLTKSDLQIQKYYIRSSPVKDNFLQISVIHCDMYYMYDDDDEGISKDLKNVYN